MYLLAQYGTLLAWTQLQKPSLTILFSRVISKHRRHEHFYCSEFISKVVETSPMHFTITLEADLHIDFLFEHVSNGIIDKFIATIDNASAVNLRFAHAFTQFQLARSTVWAPSLTY
jgi:hypothetical protein